MLLYCVLTYTTVREKKRYGARLVMRLAYIFPFEGEKEKGRWRREKKGKKGRGYRRKKQQRPLLYRKREGKVYLHNPPSYNVYPTMLPNPSSIILKGHIEYSIKPRQQTRCAKISKKKSSKGEGRGGEERCINPSPLSHHAYRKALENIPYQLTISIHIHPLQTYTWEEEKKNGAKNGTL